MDLDKKNTLIERIRKAFSGVRLENGIGLHEAGALDEYADKQTQMRYRQKDELNDWQSIPVEELELYSDHFAFFDSKSWRFHLPALLIAELEGKAVSITGYLTNFWIEEKQEPLKQRFGLLTDEQRSVVRYFLIEVMTNDIEGKTFENDFKKALDEYWNI